MALLLVRRRWNSRDRLVHDGSSVTIDVILDVIQAKRAQPSTCASPEHEGKQGQSQSLWCLDTLVRIARTTEMFVRGDIAAPSEEPCRAAASA